MDKEPGNTSHLPERPADRHERDSLSDSGLRATLAFILGLCLLSAFWGYHDKMRALGLW